MTLLEFARFYLSLGWSVIPLQPRSKVPAVKWGVYQERKPTDEELARWFSSGEANIGLVCGPVSGIVVVDQDSYKGKGLEIDSPLKVATGGGGTHVYFRYSGNLGNSVSTEMATDIRADGGQVVLPPSIHPNGKRYDWITKPTPELLANIPELPASTFEALSRRLDNSFDLATTIGVSEGGRNDALHKALCSVLSKLKDQDRKTVGWNTALGINNTFKPPLSEQEVQTTFKSALGFVRANPPSNGHTPGSVPSAFPRFSATRAIANMQKQDCWPTGITKIDESLGGGFRPEQSVLLFGEPKRGKSLLALNLLYRLTKSNVPCLLFDMENGYRLNDKRLIKIFTGWSDSELETEKLRPTYEKTLQKIEELPLAIVNNEELSNRYGSESLEAIKTGIEDGVSQGYKIFVVDNLLNFQVPKDEGENGYYTRFAVTLNSLATKHKITTILVHHSTTKTERDKSKTSTSFLDEEDASGVRVPHISKALGSTGIPAKVQVIFSVAADDSESKIYLWLQQQRDGPSDIRMRLNVDPKSLRIGDFSDIPSPEGAKKDDFPKQQVLTEQTPELGLGDIEILKYLANEEGYQPLCKIAAGQNLDQETADGVLDVLVFQHFVLFDPKFGYAVNAPTRRRYKNDN